TVVAIETAPQTKLERMRALGATIVPVSYDEAWVAAETHEFAGLGATFVHPFANHDFIAGHGTMGLEIMEDCPEVRSVICAISGTLDQTRDAMRLIAEKSRTIAEGAGALALAAALNGQAGAGPIVCVVSGGNIDLDKFAELVTS